MTEKPPRAMMSLAFVGLLAVAVGGVGAYWYASNRNIDKMQTEQSHESSAAMIGSLKMNPHAPHVLNTKRFTDADGDLVADLPKDPAKLVDPETLTFSYVGGDPISNETTWRELTDHLAKATGKKVAYLPAGDIDEQLWQLREGKLHLTVVNSGAVPLAVNECGFVPAYTMGKTGYTMDIIVPGESTMNSIEDLRNHTLTLVDTKSNSGYKVPLLSLKERNMAPEIDFHFNFSMGHKKSIAGIVAGQYEAAAVASDLLAREEAAGTVKPGDYKVIYTSPEYPQAAVGYAYNLKPELVKKIMAGLESFDWSKSELNKQFSAGRQGAFVPTNYKKDWEGIRHVNDAFGMGYAIREPAAVMMTPAATSTEPATAAGK